MYKFNKEIKSYFDIDMYKYDAIYYDREFDFY